MSILYKYIYLSFSFNRKIQTFLMELVLVREKLHLEFPCVSYFIENVFKTIKELTVSYENVLWIPPLF